MDQTGPEGKNIPGHFTERRAYSGLDRSDCLSPSRIFEIQGQTRPVDAADAAIITAKSV